MPENIAMEVFGLTEQTSEATDTTEPAVETKETEQEAAPEQSTAEQQKEPLKEQKPPDNVNHPDFIHGVFLGEGKDVPYQEAVTYMQKGMNYDRIKEAHDKLKSEYEGKTKYADFLFERASKAGLTPEQYMEQIAEQEISTKATELAQKTDSETLAKEVLKRDRQLEQYTAKEKELTGKLSEAEAAKQKEEQRKQMWSDFSLQYPNFAKLEDIPKEVLDAVLNGGENPIQAMRAYEYKQLQANNKALLEKIANLERNQKNKQTTVGSQKDTQSKTGEPDIGMKVFFGS